MKNVLLLILALMFQYLEAQPEKINGLKKTLTVNTSFETKAIGWVWLNSWYFEGEKTIELPFEYIETINTTEIDSIDNLTTVQKYKNTIINHKTEFSSTEKDWFWRNNYWYYNNTRVSSFPSKYEKHYTKSFSIEESDSLNKEKTIRSNIVEIIEYYCITEDWSWDSISNTWNKNNQNSASAPQYILLKTITNYN